MGYESKKRVEEDSECLDLILKIDIVSPAEKSKVFSVDQDTSLVIVVSAYKHRDLTRDGKYDYTVTRLKIVTAIFS